MKDLSKVILSKNFTLAEFVTTGTGLENIPGEKEIAALMALCVSVLQPFRDYVWQHYGKPVYINRGGGYRSPAVNALTPGSSSTSQHPKGQAADISVPGLTNQQIIDIIRMLRLPYDQLIDEEKKRGDGTISRWVHVSHNNTLPLYAQRLQWMTRRDTGPSRLKEYETVKIGLA